MSNILITPIKIDGTHYCLQNDGLTVPITSGMASTTPKMPSTVSGDNVFNIYQANPTGDPGSNDGYPSSRNTGQIKFGVHPCAEKIDIQVVGRRDIYNPGNLFDTCIINIDNVQVKKYANTGGTNTPFNSSTGKYVPPLSGIDSVNETFTHTFSSDIPCGHIVNINGIAGSLANNNVGYDVKITVTLPT